MVIEKWSIGIRPIPSSVENSDLSLVLTQLVTALPLWFLSSFSFSFVAFAAILIWNR